MFCKECGEEVNDKAAICLKCGCALKTQSKEIIIKTEREDSSLLFPILTLIGYILIYPIGFISNIVGLFLGKRKGCFLSLFIFFVIIPLIFLAIYFLIFGAVIVGNS